MNIVVLGSLAGSLINFRGALISAAVRRGHNVTGCAPAASPDVVSRLQALGARYQDIALWRTGLNPWKDILTLIRLCRFFWSSRPDVLIAYTIKPVIYGSIAGKWAGIPRVCSMITGLGYAYGKHDRKARMVHRIVERLYHASLKHNYRVFFQNPDDLRLFLERGFVDARQAVLINGSGVDVDRFRPQPIPDSVSFLMIARLIRSKGIREYAEAARVLKKKYENVSFRIVGGFDEGNPSGITREELQRWINDGALEYWGVVADVRQAIAASAVYVLPSYREGMPRTVLEAMAMARPVITTDVPGCRETVTRGVNGLLVPPEDVAALAGAMEFFIRNPAEIEAMGRRGREIAIERFDVHKINHDIFHAIGI